MYRVSRQMYLELCRFAREQCYKHFRTFRSCIVYGLLRSDSIVSTSPLSQHSIFVCLPFALHCRAVGRSHIKCSSSHKTAHSAACGGSSLPRCTFRIDGALLKLEAGCWQGSVIVHRGQVLCMNHLETRDFLRRDDCPIGVGRT
jgi:hypothetical protein